MTLFCGIDWAESHHDVAIIDGDGQLVAKKRIPDDPTGFAKLIEMLTAAGDCAEAPGSGGDRDATRTASRITAGDGATGVCRSIRWRWPATGSAARWHGRSPITPMR